MLSVILYARNDNHGYNYSKRIAISINCIAQMLTELDDEIVFIDYNTVDDFPTVIESIKDTLTEKAIQKLKVYRVRKPIHEKYKTDSPLEVIEPIARNAAIRRKNPNNKWILSTNIDMIFVAKDISKSLTDVVSNIEDGYYCLPRFEIPENLWEIKFNRNKPIEIIRYLQENSKKLHLHSVIKRPDFLQFDNPGDFQLFLRKDIIAIQGFDETMNRGWHVDSNIAKRLSMITSTKNFQSNEIFGFHCNHTKKVTFLHSTSTTENCWNKYVESHQTTSIANNNNWGLINENLEKIDLTNNDIDKHLLSIQCSLSEIPCKNYTLMVNQESYNTLVYDLPRTATYVLDHLYKLPQNSEIKYVGYNETFKKIILSFCENFNYTFNCLSLENTIKSLKTVNEQKNQIWIFDFGLDKTTQTNIPNLKELLLILNPIQETFINVISDPMQSKNKIIAINIKHTEFETIFKNLTHFHLHSHASGMSYGHPKSLSEIKKTLKKRNREQKIKSIRRFIKNFLRLTSDIM